MPPRSPAAPKKADGGESKQKDPDLVALGARLRVLRKSAGMSQEGLAEAAGLHWTYVSQAERGLRNLTYKSLLKLAKGLGVGVGALVEG